MNPNFLNDKITEANGLPVKAIILNSDLVVQHMNPECETFMTRVRLDPKDPNILNSLSGLAAIRSEMQKTFHDNSSITKEYDGAFEVGNKTSALKFVVEPKVENGQVACVLLKIISKQKTLKKAQLIKANQEALEEIKAANDALVSANEELERTNTQLKKTNDSLRKFFKIVSHDLKSALNGVRGFAELVLSENIGSDTDRFHLQMIITCTDKATNIINDLSEWNKAHSGILKPQLMAVYLRLTIGDTVKALQPIALQKTISLKAEEQDIILYSDSTIIHRILDNLITNAIKFTPNNGSISVTTQKENNEIVICIKDTGVGMTSEKIQKLFKIEEAEFISSAGTNDEIGTGFGLLLCKELADLLHGRIWCESEIKVGTSFYLAIPKHYS